MAKKILLFPFGGNAREALATISAINRVQKKWKVVGFLDDNKAAWGKTLDGVKVLGDRSLIRKYPDAQILAVPGSPVTFLERKNIIGSLNIAQKRFAQIIHPSVVIAPDARIGVNTLLMPNVVVSCGAVVGDHCVILPNTTIAHDSVVENYTCVGSNVSIAGHVRIKQLCYIGSGTSIRDHITIHERSLVGLGSTVVKDVGIQAVVAGNPAVALKTK